MPSLVLIGPAHPLRGGLATFDERLAREFIKQGWKVEIYTFSLQYPEFLFPGKTQYSDSQTPVDLDIKVCINSINPLNWMAIGNEIKNKKPDLVITRYWIPFMSPCLGTILRQIRRNHHTQTVCLVDNIIPHEKRMGDKFLTRYFVSVPDHFVCMSETVLDELKSFRSNPSVLLLDHPLYDVFGEAIPQNLARTKLNLPQDAKILMFFGFIRKYKGLDLLLEAMSLDTIKKESFILLIAGEFYEDSKPYLQIIQKHQLEHRISLHTYFIPDHQVKYFFCACDGVIQPYRSASQSGVTPLAYHFEKPSIVTRVGSLARLVPEGKAGIVCEPTAESIAIAIKKYLYSDWTTMQQYLHEEKSKLSWQHFVCQIENLTQIITDGKSYSPPHPTIS